MTHSSIEAGSQFPHILVQDINGADAELGKTGSGMSWQMVIVYRGRHCPLCTKYLHNLEAYKERFASNGIDLIAVSADSKEQLEEHLTRLDISFPICYGLTIEQMQKLGVYISHPKSEAETDHPFSEPGLFVINDDGEVQIVDISNGPAARPELETLAAGLEFIRNPDTNAPIRGTYK